jgi:disulfide bond formation protein DsbB
MLIALSLFLMDFTDILVTSYSVLTVLGQLIIVGLITLMLTKPASSILKKISDNGLLLMLIIAVLGTLGSLYFSEIAHWTPCKKCWLQRIFMYPQVILLAYALWKRDRGVAPYVLLLSIIGVVIAGVHYEEQIQAALFPPPAEVPCDETGVSCASTPFFHFGYITIPMMALTAFALNIVGSWVMMRRK